MHVLVGIDSSTLAAADGGKIECLSQRSCVVGTVAVSESSRCIRFEGTSERYY